MTKVAADPMSTKPASSLSTLTRCGTTASRMAVSTRSASSSGAGARRQATISASASGAALAPVAWRTASAQRSSGSVSTATETSTSARAATGTSTGDAPDQVPTLQFLEGGPGGRPADPVGVRKLVLAGHPCSRAGLGALCALRAGPVPPLLEPPAGGRHLGGAAGDDAIDS